MNIQDLILTLGLPTAISVVEAGVIAYLYKRGQQKDEARLTDVKEFAAKVTDMTVQHLKNLEVFNELLNRDKRGK